MPPLPSHTYARCFGNGCIFSPHLQFTHSTHGHQRSWLHEVKSGIIRNKGNPLAEQVGADHWSLAQWDQPLPVQPLAKKQRLEAFNPPPPCCTLHPHSLQPSGFKRCFFSLTRETNATHALHTSTCFMEASPTPVGCTSSSHRPGHHGCHHIGCSKGESSWHSAQWHRLNPLAAVALISTQQNTTMSSEQ